MTKEQRDNIENIRASMERGLVTHEFSSRLLAFTLASVNDDYIQELILLNRLASRLES